MYVRYRSDDTLSVINLYQHSTNKKKAIVSHNMRGEMNRAVVERLKKTSDSFFFNKTPILTHSPCVNTNQRISFKLEYLQPSGSFKDRGIGHLMSQQYHESNGKVSRFLSSSGGNAGHACAEVGRKLNVPVTVYCPTTTPVYMIDKIKSKGATVNIVGNNWNDADQHCKHELLSNGTARYVPPFDHPLIFEGNSSIIDEISSDMSSIPDCIIVTVGGGGLLNGICDGIKRLGWKDTRVVAVETTGTASYALARKYNKVTKLDKIDSIATTLGSLIVSKQCLEYNHFVDSVVVSDADSVVGCLSFLDDYRTLVEPSCGAGLSLVYNEELRRKYLQPYKNIVAVVCGGSAVNIDLISKWKQLVV